jgi:hypothetical protein
VTAKDLRNAEKLRFTRLVAFLSPMRLGIDSMSEHVGFVVDRVAMEQVFLPDYLNFLFSLSLQQYHTQPFITEANDCVFK